MEIQRRGQGREGDLVGILLLKIRRGGWGEGCTRRLGGKQHGQDARMLLIFESKGAEALKDKTLF